MHYYHGEASYLTDGNVQPPQVQRLLAHGGQLGNGRAPLLHEGQVPLHPAPPLRLRAQLIEACDSLSTEGGGVRVGFLARENKKRRKADLVYWDFNLRMWPFIYYINYSINIFLIIIINGIL